MGRGPRLGLPRWPRATPLAPLRRPLRRPPAQPPPLPAPAGRQGGQRLHLPPQALHRRGCRPHGGPASGSTTPAQPAPPGTARHRRAAKPVHLKLAPTPPPAVADPGTVFPGKPVRFFARPGEASSSRYPQGNRGLPAWQRDYTFFAASNSLEAGGSSVDAPQKSCLPPSSQHKSGA